MKQLAAMLGLLALTAIAAGAEDHSKAPLEGSKQELRALQADQTAQNNGATGGKLTDGLPQLDSPLPGATALDSAAPAKMEKEMKKRKDAQKNWLLDGVNRLEKSGQTSAHRKNSRPGETDREDDGTTDGEKDGTLLALYESEGKTAEAKTGSGHSAPPRNDPLAPFLQGWLADSPVRGKFFDDYAGRSDRSGTAGMSGLQANGPAPVARNGESLETARFSASSSPQSNPYLQVQSVVSAQDSSGIAANPASLSATPGAPVAIGASPAGLPRDPAPVTRPPDGIPPLLAPTDAQKYFPQQKKF